MISKQRTEIIRNVIRQYPQLPIRTIARHIFNHYGGLWDNNLDNIRKAINYHCGKNGDKDRLKAKEIIIRDKIVMPQTWAEQRTSYNLSPGKWLLINDIHVPFHETKPLEAALTFAQKERVTGIFINGDAWDCASLSFWPSVPRDFNAECSEFIDFLDFLIQEFPKAKIVYKGGNHECFSQDTEILTENGWLSFNDLSKNIKVGTWNINTNQIEYQYPLAIHQYEHVGLMTNIKGERTDMLITNNHRLVFKSQSSKKWIIDELENINISNNRIILPCSGNSNQENNKFTDDEIRIAGWILTDASIRKKPNSEGLYSFYQRESNYKIITSILDRLDWKYSVNIRDCKVTEIDGRILKSKPERSVTIRLLKDSHNKARRIVESRGKLPEWAFNLSNRQFTILLSSIVDGDGSRHKSCPETSWMVYKDKLFLDSLQAASVHYGYRATISKYKDKHYRLNINPGNVVHIDRLMNHVSHVDYDGIIWCVTTPNDTVVVRRNGKVSITGNSRLSRYFISKAKDLSLSPLAQMETLIGFDERDIEFLDYFQLVMAGKLPIIHGHEVSMISRSVNPARGLFLRAKTFSLCGHCHTTSQHTERDLMGNLITTWSVGCLCCLSPDYNPLGNNWNWGFAIIDIANDGNFEVANYRILPNGHVVK
jgi:hypothetical protein